MYHVVLVALVGAFMLGAWNLVHSAPRVLSLFLPRGFATVMGAVLLIIGIFCAFFAAYAMRSPEAMLGCFVQAYIGLWLMLATTSNLRGSYEDEQMLRRLFLMLGLITVVVVSALYVQDTRVIALLNLLMLGSGVALTNHYLRYLDRGR